MKTKVKKVNQKPKKPQSVITNHTHTEVLPHLSIKKTKTASDFVTEEILLESCGWNLDECTKGLDVIIRKLKELK